MTSAQKNSSSQPTEATNKIPAKDANVKAAHDQAERDIEQDPDFKPHPKTHDLDEGEIARLDPD